MSVTKARGEMVPATQWFGWWSWNIRGLEAAREAGRCYMHLNSPGGNSLSSVKELHSQWDLQPTGLGSQKEGHGAGARMARPLHRGLVSPQGADILEPALLSESCKEVKRTVSLFFVAFLFN